MDKDQMQTLVFVAVASAIGGAIRGLFRNGQKPTTQALLRVGVILLIVIVIATLIYKRIK